SVFSAWRSISRSRGRSADLCSGTSPNVRAQSAEMSSRGIGDVVEVRNLSEQAYDRIRHDILYGELFPNEKLQIDAISERYGIGAVPVREALNRLSSEGLVDRKSHRGFFVATISMADLEELVKTRVWLETLALEQ